MHGTIYEVRKKPFKPIIKSLLYNSLPVLQTEFLLRIFVTKNTPPLFLSKYMEMVSLLYIEQKLPACKIVCEYMHSQIIFVAESRQGDFRIIQWVSNYYVLYIYMVWLFICASLKQTQFRYIYLLM